MQIKFQKLHPDAVVPKYAKAGDAGADLTATSCEYLTEYNCWEYGTGIAVEIPEGFVGLVYQRSSVYSTALQLRNAVAVIDAGFRGEIKLKFGFSELGGKIYSPGERIAQLVITPIIRAEFVEVEELADSERGSGGFGSTGVN